MAVSYLRANSTNKVLPSELVIVHTQEEQLKTHLSQYDFSGLNVNSLASCGVTFNIVARVSYVFLVLRNGNLEVVLVY